MKATIYDAAGNAYQLPVLLSWDISHGFCKPSDCFEVKFLYQAEMKEALLAACRFEARFKDRIVFYGVVDEEEFCADSNGCIAVLRGRGMQALLLDSQAESADYMKADIQFILNRHVIAQGIDRYEIGGKSTGKTASLSVSSGESHWSVLSRYTEFCLGLRPRFRPDGTLLLDGADYPNANAKNCSNAFDKFGHGAAACVSTSVTCAWAQAESDGSDFVAQSVAAAERMKKNLTRYVQIL